MNIYIFLCVLFAVSALIERLLPIKTRKALFFINGIVLLIIVGGRSCGTDYWLYQSVIKHGGIDEAMWPLLFSFMVKILPFQLVIIGVAVLTIIPFYIIIYRFAKNLYNLAAAFFFTEYFFMTLMQQSRQGIALAGIACCIFFFSTQKIRTAFIVLSTTLVHITGFFGLLLISLQKKFYRLRTYIIVYATALLTGEILFNFLLQKIGNIGILFITNKVIGYANRTDALDAFIPLFNFRFLLFFLLIFYCYSKKTVIKNGLLPYLCNILFLGICFYTLFYLIVDLAVRGSSCFISIYFFIILLLLQEKSICKLHRNLIYWFSFSYCIYLMFRYMDMIVEQNSDLGLIPYSFL